MEHVAGWGRNAWEEEREKENKQVFSSLVQPAPTSPLGIFLSSYTEFSVQI